MKKFLLSAFTLSLVSITNAQNWTIQSSGTSVNLNSIHFTSPTNGIVVGDNGKILLTTSGGNTWSAIGNVYSGSPVNFTDVFSMNTDAWITTSSGNILFSTNAGTSWSVSNTPMSTASIDNIHFGTSLIGWAVGNTPSVLYKTIDGGMSWTSEPLTPFTNGAFKGIQCIGTNTVLLIKGNRFYFSSDAGSSWNYQTFSTNIASLKSVSAATNWLTGGQTGTNDIYKITSFGTYTGASGNLNGGPYTTIDAFDANNAMVASGLNANVYKTTNGGTNWTQESIPGTINYLNKINYVDVNNAWAVGGSGSIIKYGSVNTNTTTPTTTTEVTEIKTSSVSIYPNPASTHITIVSNNPLGFVTITNNLGIAVIRIEIKDKTWTLDVSVLHTGTYFIKVGSCVTKFIKD
jgi:photosystem II stability/assembly factor-like uncharacterized protein